MANKYIIHGATYNGDGTSSAEATSDGGVGAWNNINIFQGTAPTYGTLAAGDVVYIRSKDASGNDITVTVSTTGNYYLGSSSANASLGLRWVIDGGTVWSGVSGVVKYVASNYAIFYPRSYNTIEAEVQDSFVLASTVSSGDASLLYVADCRIRKALIDYTGQTGAAQGNIFGQVGYAILEDCHFKFRGISAAGAIRCQATQCGIVLINPDIELTASASSSAVFGASSTVDVIEVIGGQIRGTGATSPNCLVGGTYTCGFSAIGLQFPVSLDVVSSTSLIGDNAVWSTGCEGGLGAVYWRRWGLADSRQDGNFPYLNAVLPDSGATGWSWKVYPKSADIQRPMGMAFSHTMTGSAAAKTVTLELLVATAMTSVNTLNTWMDVHYVDDATGQPKRVSTRALSTGAALSSSTAAWSADFYGAISFNKRKLEVTTPTSVKQNTSITVCLYSIVASATANDILCVDPVPVIA